MKDFFEKHASTRRKTNYHWEESLKKGEKNDFHLPESHLSTSVNELFLLKLFTPYSNNGFH